MVCRINKLMQMCAITQIKFQSFFSQIQSDKKLATKENTENAN